MILQLLYILCAIVLLLDAENLGVSYRMENKCRFSDGDWFKPLKGKTICYQLVWQPEMEVTWTAARYHCRNMTGLKDLNYIYLDSQLLWIEDEEEANFVLEVLKWKSRMDKEGNAMEYGNKVNVWVNAHGYIYNRDGPAWASGEPFSSTDSLRLNYRETTTNDLHRRDCFSLDGGSGWGTHMSKPSASKIHLQKI